MTPRDPSPEQLAAANQQIMQAVTTCKTIISEAAVQPFSSPQGMTEAILSRLVAELLSDPEAKLKPEHGDIFGFAVASHVHALEHHGDIGPVMMIAYTAGQILGKTPQRR